MTDSFVNTFNRYYISRMDLANAKTAMAQMAAAFKNFNEVHPLSSLKLKLPREFRQHCGGQQRFVQVEQALH